LVTDASGNVYVTGYFNGTVDFDPGPGTFAMTSTNNDVFIVKLDAGGNLAYARQFSGPDSDRGIHLAVDNLGGLIISGIFGQTCDFDPGPGTYMLTSLGSSDVFVGRLDPSGNLDWVGRVGGTGTENVEGHALDGANNIYISGQFVWAKAIVGSGSEIPHDIDVDQAGRAYLTGRFSGSFDADPGPGVATVTAAGSPDLLLMSLDMNGELRWYKSFGNPGVSYAYAIQVNDSDGLHVAGMFSNGMDFDPGPGAAPHNALGDVDGFLMQMDTAGGFRSVKILSSNGADIVQDFDLGPNGVMYHTGYFSDVIDFNTGPGTFFANNLDIFPSGFVLKHALCAPITGATQSVATCGPYTWPQSGLTYSQTGVYTMAFAVANGCDSVLTLDFRLDTVQAGISNNGSTLTALNSGPGITYQWIDCATGQPLQGVFQQSFTPTQSGNYAVVVANATCQDTSACEFVTVAGNAQPMTASLIVFPNPNSGSFKVGTAQAWPLHQIRLYDLQGREIAQIDAQGKTEIEVVQSLAPGSYVVSASGYEGHIERCQLVIW
jgi:hypothetical protein